VILIPRPDNATQSDQQNDSGVSRRVQTGRLEGMLHFALLEITGGILRSNGGHKTWVAWAIAGVFLVAGILVRLYRRR
jgi:hypothetical protein